MPNALFRLSVDTPNRLITLRLKGAETSAFYTEQMLKAYDDIDSPWLYNRLLDYRQFNGMIESADVERLARHWRDLTEGQGTTSKIAVLTEDPLTPVRASAYHPLFPRDEIRTFQTLTAALDWLNTGKAGDAGES